MRPHRMLLAAVAATALGAACGGAPPGNAPAAPAADAGPTGGVLVRVALHGTPPPPASIRLDADPKCIELEGQATRLTEDIVTGEGAALQHVFVYVKEGVTGSYPVPTDPVIIDQQSCRYVPRVLGIRVGQPLEIRNSDPLLHNVRAEGRYNEGFNLGQPIAGLSMTRVFATTEVMVPIKCDVHAWMRAWVGVLDHPFFGVTGPAGTVELARLPAGRYVVEAWHEHLGTRTATVTIAPGETKDVSLTFEL
ncbi:MAG: TonB-dependent receptor [Acidobacteriota bacterium]